jgi:hypothetical protein
MPYRTIQVKAPLFMRHKGAKVYRIFKNDDADGDIRQYSFTFDPIEGGDDQNDGIVNFDVRDLSTWAEPPHPPSLSGDGDTPANRKAWKRHRDERVEEKTIKAAIRAALDKGEIGPRAGDRQGNGRKTL